MKVRLVSLSETKAAHDAGAPALTPEMLAAVGARYSRNGEGLDAILARVDRSDPDKAVDSIFRMVDYGHQSIADMTVVPMFIDGASIWLIYHLWASCARASGQESSTRYLRFDEAGLITPALTGIPEALWPEWHAFIQGALAHYQAAATFWETVALAQPARLRLPPELLDESLREPDGKAAKTVARLRRNFVFDRARYWLPTAALSNVMLVMAARDWMGLCQNLLSHPVPEAAHLGAAIAAQLPLSAPRLSKHARATLDWTSGHLDEIADDAALASTLAPIMERNTVDASVSVHVPQMSGLPALGSLPEALAHHPHRYSWTGRELRRVQVRYGLNAVAFAELRDLNRHRTGYKFAPIVPVGFYGARDQTQGPTEHAALEGAMAFGVAAAERQREFTRNGASWQVYWGLLGTQIPYEHGTTLDKMIYEIELRTGTGAHYRYAEHMRGVHDALVRELPSLQDQILLGTGEPE